MDTSPAAAKVCYRCLIGGQVQGVFFRAATREQAMRLGLTGYARNLADGRVEVVVAGEIAAVAQLRDWLRTGPTMARVTGLVYEPLDYQPHSGFMID